MDMNVAFDYCVELLEHWAVLTGTTYKEINIWIFVIIEPIVFVVMSLWIWWLLRRVKSLKKTTSLSTLGAD
ncbi:hypothetical protein [Sanyastnella coralliicola]|uniref:hypothetical protein n=1 Tax=Sanyastnella coralliicola TaxID=3069118 RepID=UPI0027B9CB9B|nr:hypothetical protein [Longitalea sp. SCSIO 12813]